MGVRSRRFAWVMLTLAFLFGVLPAHADGEGDLTVLTPPPVPPLASFAPVVKRGANLAPFVNLVVIGVDVVIAPEQHALWPDVKTPTVGILKSGDILTQALIRGARRASQRVNSRTRVQSLRWKVAASA